MGPLWVYLLISVFLSSSGFKQEQEGSGKLRPWLLWLPQRCCELHLNNAGCGCLWLQEVEALLGENEMLQGKLHSQEEDFRLQNSTLMSELSKVRPQVSLHLFYILPAGFLTAAPFLQLCTQIEQLEQDNQRLKEGGGASDSSPTPGSAPGAVDGELLRLQAENSALQKKLKGECDTGTAVGPSLS